MQMSDVAYVSPTPEHQWPVALFEAKVESSLANSRAMFPDVFVDRDILLMVFLDSAGPAGNC